MKGKSEEIAIELSLCVCVDVVLCFPLIAGREREAQFGVFCRYSSLKLFTL